jgi:hypothetical protein
MSFSISRLIRGTTIIVQLARKFILRSSGRIITRILIEMYYFPARKTPVYMAVVYVNHNFICIC